MKFKCRRLASMSLTMCMVLSQIPATAFAAEDTAAVQNEIADVVAAQEQTDTSNEAAVQIEEEASNEASNEAAAQAADASNEAATQAVAAETIVSSWSDLQTALNNGGNIKLGGNITASSSDSRLKVPSGVTATLDLNGYTIDRGLTSATSDGNVIVVKGTLTINDSSSGMTGKITGAYSSSGTYNGGGVCVYSGTFILNSGNISGNRTPDDSVSYGAGVSVEKGTFIMNGGCISDNHSGWLAGGLSVSRDSSAQLLGGKIINNSALKTYGGGAYIYTDVTVGGDLVVENNKVGVSYGSSAAGVTNNLQPASGKYVLLSEDKPLTKDAKIGLMPDSYATITENGLAIVKGKNVADYVDNFVADKGSSYILGVKDGDSETIYYAREGSTVVKKPSAASTVTIKAGKHMTKTSDSGDETQSGLTEAMTSVVYTAEDGYYFPEDYASKLSSNGITVTRDSESQITVSGTPTADTTITLPDATEAPEPVFSDGMGGTISLDDLASYTKGETKNEKGYVFAGWFDSEGNELTNTKDAVAGTTYTAKWTAESGKTVRTEPLDFSEDDWKTGCTQDGSVWTNKAEGWSWDADTNTLTLNGVTFDVYGMDALGYFPGEATIQLADGTENTVIAHSEYGNSTAIDTEYTLTIAGGGKLTATGEAVGIEVDDGDLNIKARVSASATSEDDPVAVMIYTTSAGNKYKINLDPSLGIKVPEGGSVDGLSIVDSDGNEAAEVVIDYSSYEVTLPAAISHGQVSVDKTSAAKGEDVTITVTPDDEYSLEKLTVTDKNNKEVKLTDKGNGKYTFTMPDSKVKVKASFAKTTYSVSLPTDVKNGTITADKKTAVKGEDVTITVAPNIEYSLEKLTVTDKSGKNVELTDKGNGKYTFTMPSGGVSIDGSFAKNTYKIETADVKNGSISSELKSASQGDEVTITVTPDEEYSIKNVTVTDSRGKEVKLTDNGDGTYTFTMPSGKVDVTASFEQITYNVVTKMTDVKNGTVSTDVKTAAKGDTVTITAKADEEYSIKNVTATDKDGKEIKLTDNGDGTYSFTMPSGKVDVTASFEQITYDVAAAETENGSVSVDKASAAKGDTVTITAKADEEYSIKNVTATDKDGKEIKLTDNGDGTYSFTMPSGKVDVTASFKQITYDVAAAKTENGSVSVDKTSAAKGDTVTITAKADAGYLIKDVTATDKDGKEIKLTDNGDGTYSFTMPSGKVDVKASIEAKFNNAAAGCEKGDNCPISQYKDTKVSDWYHDGVHFVLDNKLMVGFEDNTFRPNEATSRAMITTILWRLEGEPTADYTMSFRDVEDGRWYTEAIRWAQSTGIIKGYDENTFGVNDVMTREQTMTVLYRYAKYKGYDVSAQADLSAFSDAANVSNYAVEAAQWAVGAGIIVGDKQADGVTLNPKDNSTRAQAATMLMRYCTILK